MSKIERVIERVLFCNEGKLIALMVLFLFLSYFVEG